MRSKRNEGTETRTGIWNGKENEKNEETETETEIWNGKKNEKKDEEEIGIQRRADHHLDCADLRTGSHRYRMYRDKTSIVQNFVLVCCGLLDSQNLTMTDFNSISVTPHYAKMTEML